MSAMRTKTDLDQCALMAAVSPEADIAVLYIERKPHLRCMCKLNRATVRKRTLGTATQFLLCANAARVWNVPSLPDDALGTKVRFSRGGQKPAKTEDYQGLLHKNIK
jgi:hypothetical protein